jgi:deoxycytidylate deaminase
MKAKPDDVTKSAIKYFQAAAEVAKKATCLRGNCGAVIVKDGQIIGEGYNSPPLDDDSQRKCECLYDFNKKPKFDKTCCIHAEWRAIFNALRRYPAETVGSTLYFMRIDDEKKGEFTGDGVPFCTVCSRLALEAGIAHFALWNGEPKIFDTKTYNRLSYDYHQPHE